MIVENRLQQQLEGANPVAASRGATNKLHIAAIIP
jgi:hypothetical protein